MVSCRDEVIFLMGYHVERKCQTVSPPSWRSYIFTSLVNILRKGCAATVGRKFVAGWPVTRISCVLLRQSLELFQTSFRGENSFKTDAKFVSNSLKKFSSSFTKIECKQIQFNKNQAKIFYIKSIFCKSAKCFMMKQTFKAKISTKNFNG